MPDISKRVAKAQKYMEKGKYDDALKEYQAAWNDNRSNDSLLEMMADLYVRQNEAQKALDCYGYLFDKRVEQKDGPGTVLMYRKMARLGSQDPARTLTCARFSREAETGRGNGTVPGVRTNVSGARRPDSGARGDAPPGRAGLGQPFSPHPHGRTG